METKKMDKELQNTNIGSALHPGIGIKEGQDVTEYSKTAEPLDLDNVECTDPDKLKGTIIPTTRPTGGSRRKDGSVSIYGDIVPGKVITGANMNEIDDVSMEALKENEERLQEELQMSPEERDKKLRKRIDKHNKLVAKRRKNYEKHQQEEQEHYALSAAYKKFDPKTGQYIEGEYAKEAIKPLSLWQRIKLAFWVIFRGGDK
jgi:hypothetical protein